MFPAAWVIRLGWLADYFSRPVLVGYIHGVAIVLVCGQLGKLLGIDVDAREPIGQVVDVFGALGDVSGATILVSAIALGALIAARFFVPRLPASLIVVVAAIAVSWAIDLEQHGVAVVGEIPSGLPSPTIPTPPLGDVASLLPAAIGIFLVSFADGILTARTFAGKNNQHVRANQELLAFAGMSAAAGVTQGLPLGASGSRTAVNDEMGARTQIAGLVAAGAIALVLLFLTTPMSYLPSAVLGAIIVSAAIGLVDPSAWPGLAAVSRFEIGLAAATTVGVVALGVLQALVIAVALSIVDVVRRSAKPHDAVLGWVDRLGRYANVELHRSARVTPGVVV
jgi:MFS superfamily sulfate permease-like transporter